MSSSINLNLLVRLRRPCSAIHSSRTTTIDTEATIKQCEIKLARFSVNDPTERSAAACESRPSDRFEGKNRWEISICRSNWAEARDAQRDSRRILRICRSFCEKECQIQNFSFRRFPTVWKWPKYRRAMQNNKKSEILFSLPTRQDNSLPFRFANIFWQLN